MRSPLRLGAGLLVGLFVAAAPGRAQTVDELVTPVRIGRADAPLVLSMWAQQARRSDSRSQWTG